MKKRLSEQYFNNAKFQNKFLINSTGNQTAHGADHYFPSTIELQPQNGKKPFIFHRLVSMPICVCVCARLKKHIDSGQGEPAAVISRSLPLSSLAI